MIRVLLLLCWLGCSAVVAQIPTAVSPSSGIALYGPAVTLTVTGTGFLPGDDVVLMGLFSIDSFGTTYVNPTTLQTTIPAAAMTTPIWAATGVNVGIVRGGVPPSTFINIGFCVPAGIVTTVSPPSVPAGSGPVTLTLTGNYFIGTGFAWFDSSPVPTIINSQTQATITVPASLLATPRTVQIDFIHDLGGASICGNGVAATFTVTVPPFDGTITCTNTATGVSIDLAVVSGTPHAAYQFLVAATNPGMAPSGAFFGLNLTLAELIAEIGNSPFAGTLDATGSASHAITLPGLACPIGVLVDAVVLEFSPITGALLRWDTPETLSL